MRYYVPRIHAAGAELVILGNGTPEQARWFVEDYDVTTPVLTDPNLASHRIVGTGKLFLGDPRTSIQGVRAFTLGHRQTGIKGHALELGGVFVITPASDMPYRYLSKFGGDHPDPEDAIGVLEAHTQSEPDA